MTGEEKAAVVLMHLHPEVVDAVLRRLGGERGQRLRAHVERLRASPQPPGFLEEVFRDLEASLQAPPEPPPPPPAPPPKPVAKAPPPPEKPPAPAASPPASPPEKPARAPEPAEGEDPLRALGRVDPDRLTLALQGENARPVALVLSYLEIDQAGEVFKRLPSPLRREVSVLLTSPLPGIEVARRIAQAVLEKSKALADVPTRGGADDRVKKLAEMLRQLGKAERTDVLEAMQQRDEATAAAVREQLYQFADLLALDGRSVQKVLAEVDSKSLAVALKGAPDEIKEKVLANLSQRAREALLEELEFLGSVPADQVRQAERMITEVVQRLDLAGEINGLG